MTALSPMLRYKVAQVDKACRETDAGKLHWRHSSPHRYTAGPKDTPTHTLDWNPETGPPLLVIAATTDRRGGKIESTAQFEPGNSLVHLREAIIIQLNSRRPQPIGVLS